VEIRALAAIAAELDHTPDFDAEAALRGLVEAAGAAWVREAPARAAEVFDVYRRWAEARLVERRFGGGQTPAVRETVLLRCVAAGVQFVADEGALERLEPGDALWLVQEPDNPFDPYAIRLVSARCERLGYLPRRFTGVVGRLLRLGVPVIARVAWVDAEYPPVGAFGIEAVVGRKSRDERGVAATCPVALALAEAVGLVHGGPVRILPREYMVMDEEAKLRAPDDSVVLGALFVPLFDPGQPIQGWGRGGTPQPEGVGAVVEWDGGEELWIGMATEVTEQMDDWEAAIPGPSWLGTDAEVEEVLSDPAALTRAFEQLGRKATAVVNTGP
jgi:hypothetical protein